MTEILDSKSIIELVNKTNKNFYFIDLETTSKEAEEARIVEFSLLKVEPNSNCLDISGGQTARVNPGIDIPEEATSINGISNDNVKNMFKFSVFSKQIAESLVNCVLVGFNLHEYDLVVLKNEFLRVGQKWNPETNVYIDSLRIWWKMEDLKSGKLNQCHEFYTKLPHDGFHKSMDDVNALFNIFSCQIEKYNLLEKTVEEISKISPWFSGARLEDSIDKYFLKNEKDEYIFNFGKYKGRNVDDLQSDINLAEYMIWLLSCKDDLAANVKLFAQKVAYHLIPSDMKFLSELGLYILKSPKSSEEYKLRKVIWLLDMINKLKLEDEKELKLFLKTSSEFTENCSTTF